MIETGGKKVLEYFLLLQLSSRNVATYSSIKFYRSLALTFLFVLKYQTITAACEWTLCK